MVRVSILPLLLLVSQVTSYDQTCIDVTQPPYFVKLYLYFKNGCKWTDDATFTAQSIASYGHCCLGDASKLPGNCTCPLASQENDKHQQFVDAMYGKDGKSGWCDDVKAKCGL